MDTQLNQSEITKWESFIQKSDTQSSPILFDALSKNPIPINQDLPNNWVLSQIQILSQIQSIIKSIELIITLGQAEHTGDWDPYIIINLIDGGSIETQNGYHHMGIQRGQFQNTLLLEDEEHMGNQNDGDISYHIINISNIKSIQLLR